MFRQHKVKWPDAVLESEAQLCQFEISCFTAPISRAPIKLSDSLHKHV